MHLIAWQSATNSAKIMLKPFMVCNTTFMSSTYRKIMLLKKKKKKKKKNTGSYTIYSNKGILNKQYKKNYTAACLMNF